MFYWYHGHSTSSNKKCLPFCFNLIYLSLPSTRIGQGPRRSLRWPYTLQILQSSERYNAQQKDVWCGRNADRERARVLCIVLDISSLFGDCAVPLLLPGTDRVGRTCYYYLFFFIFLPPFSLIPSLSRVVVVDVVRLGAALLTTERKKKQESNDKMSVVVWGYYYYQSK